MKFTLVVIDTESEPEAEIGGYIRHAEDAVVYRRYSDGETTSAPVDCVRIERREVPDPPAFRPGR